MEACSIGLHNLVKKTLNNKPYFSYKENGNFGTITILDSFTKKINIKNSIGVANTVATSINTAINNGYKNIGNVAFVGFDDYNRGIVNIKATNNQLNLINAIDNSKEAEELQKEVDKEREIEEERALRESKKEEWEENREYFENDEPFTRASSANTQDSLFGLDEENKNLEFNITTLNAVSNFLQNIGVEKTFIPSFLNKDGSIIKGAIAAANFIKGTIDISENERTNILNDSSLTDEEKSVKISEFWKKVDSKLPEEAAHWWYRLLSTNSELKKALWLSSETAEKNNELYGTKYGKLEGINTPEDLTEESIGQLIADAIKRIEEKNANASDYSFFKKFLEWINSIIDMFNSTEQDPFEVAAMKILSSDISDLISLEDYIALTTENLGEKINPMSDISVIDEKVYQSLIKRLGKKKRLPLPKTIEKLKLILSKSSLTTDKLTEEDKKTLDVKDYIPSLLSFNKFTAKFKKGIPTKDNLALDGVKSFDNMVYSAVRDLILNTDDFKGKTIIPYEDFIFYLNEFLEKNYLINFQVLKGWEDYKINSTFKDKTARHRKIGLRFNNEYFKQTSHFSFSPLAWGNITYFKSDPSMEEPDSALIHEIQNDFWERLGDLTGNVEKNINLERALKLPTLFRNLPKDTKLAYTQFKQKIEEYKNLKKSSKLDLQKTSTLKKIKELNYALKAKLPITPKELTKLYNELQEEANSVDPITGTQNPYVHLYINKIQYNFKTDEYENSNVGLNRILGELPSTVSFKRTKLPKSEKQLAYLLKLKENKQISKLLVFQKSQLLQIFKQIAKYNSAEDYDKLSFKQFEKIYNNIEYNKSFYQALIDKETNITKKNELYEKYFTPLVHHLLQTVIKEKGKNFKVYVPGKEIVLLSQVQIPNEKTTTPTADLYATPEDVNNGKVSKIGVMFNNFKKVHGISLEYKPNVEGFVKPVDAYQVNLKNYDFDNPIMFGLDLNEEKPIKPGKPFTRVFDVNTQIQKKLQELYPEINLNITNKPVWEQGNDVLNQEEYDKEVAYRLKAVEILLSDKAKQIFEKGNKNNWDLNKILTELAVPKDQKQLILDSDKTNIEDIITNLLADYSYTVEINIAKSEFEKKVGVNEGYAFIYQGSEYNAFFNPGGDIEYEKDGDQISEKEYFKAKKEGEKTTTAVPTQYYSNLTVPGGTNYTENEIATPAITPSIKGHAQFATDNGIGWFRSDELTSADVNDRIERGEPMNVFDELAKSANELKTRRILEVQSDLFQKGRDKQDLVQDERVSSNIKDSTKEDFEVAKRLGVTERDEEGNLSYTYKGVNYFQDIFSDKYLKYILPTFNRKENNFLQLLNKDNNWVTFFVKSIIQDSAKKGYEKVLFSSGNTASKVEGHSTLEQFKKQKEDRIKELETDKELLNTILKKENYRDDGNSFVDNRTVKIPLKYNTISGGKTFEETKQATLNKVDNEINQLKQELERVETEGFGALKPIYKFYEETVFNVLKKQGYNPVLITDEYGNTWNEITINQARELQNVLLQKNEANRIIGQANIKAMSVLIDAVNKKEDTLPHEYAHHYIAWFRNTPIVQEAIKKWGSEEALVQSIGEQVVKQKGKAYDWWKKFTDYIMDLFNNLSTKDKQELTNILTDAFLSGIDLENNNVGISRERSKELASKASGIFNQEKPIKPGVEELFDSNQSLANAVYEALVPTGYTRLYRAENEKGVDTPAPLWLLEQPEIVAQQEAQGRWFYKSYEEAKYHADKFDSSGISYIDVPTNIVEQFNAKDNKFAGGYGKEGKEYFVSKEIAVNKKSFNPQQAQQLYSSYLDTIFPDSKVKDIVYHGTNEQFDIFKIPFYAEDMYGEDAPIGVFFSTDKQYTFNFGKRNISAILNLKNPKFEKEIEYEKVAGYRLGKKELEFDGLYGNDKIDLRDAKPSKGTEYVVFEPEQIHILSSKEDIEGFKKFVGESTQTVESYRAQEQAELSQRIPNIENYKVNGKVVKSLITDENDLEIYNEIYDKYDALITPLLEASEETKEQVETTDSLEELLDNKKLDFQDAILIDLINKVAPNQESLPTTEEVVEELPSQQLIDSQKQNNSYSDLVSTIKGLMNTLGIKIVKAEAIYLKQQEINALYNKLASSKSDTEKQSIQKQIDKLKREGVRKNVLGLADTLNGVINLALSENNIDESEFALNEEMLHFIVDIIEQKYPDLYKELLQKVGTYNLYNQMYSVYASQKEYQNEDGSVNINKIKKEAIAKVLNDFLSNPEYSEEDYQLSKTQNLWNKIKATLKSFFEEKSNKTAANNFRFTLDRLLNDPNFITKEDAKLLSGEEFFGIWGTISSWKENKIIGKESAFNTKRFLSPADFVKYVLEIKSNSSKVYVDKNTNKITSPTEPNSIEKYTVKTPTGTVIVASRVSNFVTKFLDKIFPNSSSKNNKELELAAERGVIIHNIFELTFAKYVDPATGIIRKQPINSSPQLEIYEKRYAKEEGLSMPEKIDKYVKELIALYPNSYFLTEVPIFNKSLTIGGTIDLMIVDSNKKIHIYDWKTKKADIHKGQGIIQKREKIDPWNIKAWRIQLDSYMDILKNSYSVESFGKVRMIPIMTEFESDGKTISNINIGSESNPDIRQRQLLAVPSKQELTGFSETDKLIKANYGLAEKLQNKANKVSDISEKEKLRLQSSVLEDLAIDLQVGKGIQSLVNKLEQILKIHDDIIEKDRNGEIKGSDLPIIASAIVDLSIYAADNRLANVAGELFSRFENLTDLQKETKKELESLSVQVSNKVAELKKVLINSAEILGNDQGIYEVGKIENEIENSPGIISFSKIRAQRNSIYQLNFKTGQLFGNLVRGIQNNVERQRLDVRNTLEKIKVDYLKDFGGVFKSDESVFSILFRYPTQEEIKNGAIDGPKLVAKIDKKFYASLKEQKEKFVNLVNASIKTKKDFTKTAGYTELVKWLESNIDLEAWRKNYIERKEKQKNLLKTQYSYIEDDYERDYAIEQALTSWEYRYNILKSPAALNSNNVSAFINEEKWLSSEYKKIKSFPSALAAYNAFREIMFNARRVGYIQDLSQISEIPTNITTKNKLIYYYSLVKLHGSLKYLYFNSIPEVLNNMLIKPLESNLALDDIKSGFSNINPITQEEELELPIYMLRDFNVQVDKNGRLKSLKDLDLFKVYEELAFHVINFENLSATEELADAIIMVEESKTLEKQMNAQGNTNENKVKAKEIKTREEILKHAKNFIYYNKTKEKDKTTVFNFSVNKFVEYTKSYAAALYLGANHALAFKAFTASTLSAFSNAGDIYSKRNVLFSPLRRIVSSGLIEKSFNYHVSSSNLHENRLKNNNYAKKAAVYGKEYLFNSLTVVDYEIQKNLFFAALPNFTIIEENRVKKIVNIDKYVDDKYPNIFEESPQKRKEIFEKKNKEKEKLRKNSLVEQLQERAKKVKKGDMSIDLSDIDTESIDKFTNKIQEGAKRVLGNMSDKDIYLWKTGNLPSLLTQFKGFAFKIFDVRWGDIKYNTALERYTYGKMSALSNFLLTKEQVIDENNQEILKTKFTFLSTIIRFLQISAPFLNVKENEQVIQILKIKYLQYATDAKNKNQTVMSEREYMEMYLTELTSAKNELYVLLVFAGLFAFAAGGDDNDDDPWLKYLKNIIRGVTKELLFPYSPNQLSSMVVLSFPGLGALTALFNAFSFQFGNVIEFTKDSPVYVKVDPFRYTVGERLSPVIKATPYVRPISALLAQYNADWRKFLDVDKKSRSLVKNRIK